MSSPASSPNHYLKTKILTASPAELRMMLLDGAVRFARKGSEAVARKDFEAAYEGVTRAEAIVMELINALRPDQDPELCKRLSGLYTYIYNRLVRGLTDRDTLVLDEAVRLLEFEAETWRMALERLNHEREPQSQPSRLGTPNQAAGGAVSQEPQPHEASAGGLLSVTG